MRKRRNQILAAVLSATLMLSATGISSTYAQETVQGAETSDVLTELLAQDQTVDEAAIDQIKAILFNCTDYNLREYPGGKDMGITLYSGQQLVLLSYVIAEDGSGWYQVSVSVNGTVSEGYIEEAYVLCMEADYQDRLPVEDLVEQAKINTVSDTETDTEEAQTGAAEKITGTDAKVQAVNADFEASIAAFPESYKANLRALHAAHPNWVFVPQITNIDWDTFIAAEMTPERSLVPRSMDDSYKGKQSWAYDPITGEYKGLSGYNWVQASEAAVMYYADPRNFLTEDTIFQFELLTYNSNYQTEEGVEAIINGTFMSHAQMADDVVTYAKAFCLAGAQTNVSPFMLAARVRQEQGAAGTSPLISGLYPGYEGYYNFFNIQAFGTTETEIYVNGLNYAKAQGWNTRYNSIAGGASILSGNYISKGQDTLYLQKFDVDDSYYGLFSHQYMQNILGALNEGKTAYSVYSGMNILDNTFVFKIPVYNNMPVAASPRPDLAKVNEKEVKAFVTRLYQNILKRNADEAGLYYWYTCLANGETAASVVAKFVNSDEFINQKTTDEDYVERMYTTMMNRKSDASGKAYWLDVLSAGCSRKYVLAQFIGSAEFTSICDKYGVTKGQIKLTEGRDHNVELTKYVRRLYQTALNRKPDTDGLNYWTEAIWTKTRTPYDVASQFINSQEFKNKKYSDKEYLTILYRTFFDREPDADGYAYWQKQLKAGMSRDTVLKKFAYSDEFKKLTESYGLK